jgi:uncharacterized protein YwgA
MLDSRAAFLASFLKYVSLDRRKIIRGGIANCIMAQKLVYFGKTLGLPLDYDFNLYLYGPYSSALADDYFRMGEEEWGSGQIEITASVSSVLDELRKRDDLFLEIAATLHSLKTANPDASYGSIIKAVSDLKADRTRKKVCLLNTSGRHSRFSGLISVHRFV